MQNVSSRYKEQMNNSVRNRGHVRITIGVNNQQAQNHATVNNGHNYNLAYYSVDCADYQFKGDTEIMSYAADEVDYTRVDGSMYFLPKQDSGYAYLNCGIVTEHGGVYITFDNEEGYFLRGLTINFGDIYPTKFTLVTDSGSETYENNSPVFILDETIEYVSYVQITPIEMLGGTHRFRINSIAFGISNVFSDSRVINCNISDYVSPIGDSVPSRDISLTIDNRDGLYAPDNPDNAISFMEVGQAVSIAFGYDLDRDGNETEWVEPFVGFLSTWNANKSTATFSATDKYSVLSRNTYYRGKYRASGISLYDLAIDVLTDAGIVDDFAYSIDGILRNIIVYNPIPAVKHSEALQIIANAARCTLALKRNGDIQIKSSYVPEVTATSNGETEYSDVTNILNDENKKPYAHDSMNYTPVDGSAYFASINKESGYYSESMFVVGAGATVEDSTLVVDASAGWYVNGTVLYATNATVVDGALVVNSTDRWTSGNPKITLTPEEPSSVYQMTIIFGEVYPLELKVRSFDENNVIIKEVTYSVSELFFTIYEDFIDFSKMEIEFTKGADNSRVVVNNIIFSDVMGYSINKSAMKEFPIVARQGKIKSLSVTRTLYSTNNEQKELSKGSVVVSPTNNVYTVYINDASYGYSVSVTSPSGVIATITDSSDFFVEITFSHLSDEITVEYTLNGYQYTKSLAVNTRQLNQLGEEIVWNNPLVSTRTQAESLIDWLGDYYAGTFEYDFSWRGDPCIDANDLIGIENALDNNFIVRVNKNTLAYSGAWSGTINARKVV